MGLATVALDMRRALAGLLGPRQLDYAARTSTREVTFYAAGGFTGRYAELLEKQLKVKLIAEDKPGESATTAAAR